MTLGKWDNNGDCNFTDDTKNDSDDLNNTIGEATPPIGSIVAWHASLTGVPASLPDGYVECNGQVLSDADSPMNGETMPDLNNATDATSRFLKGDSTSGSPGGGTITDHDHSITNWSSTAGDSPTHYIPQGNNTSDEQELPPYIDMRWIIRVK